MKAAILAATVCLLVVRKSFVDTAPADGPQVKKSLPGQLENADEVQQLENLKQLGNSLAVLKTHSSSYTNLNGQRESHSDTREEVDRDGKLVASVGQHVDSNLDSDSATPSSRIETEIEVPSRGIHKTVVSGGQQEVTDNGDRRSAPANNLYSTFSGIQYTPLEMAEYIFWTGDEKGVTLAIEEFLQEGLMTREEAISFLQEIKYSLDYLQVHYSQQRQQQTEEQQQATQQQAQERAGLMQKMLRLGKTEEVNPADVKELVSTKKNVEEISNKESSKGVIPVTLSRGKEDGDSRPLLTDEDYEEMLERLRVADYLYTEYSLEEVIYQLAKVMFSQSLTKGSAEAQEALQKFTTFLEGEALQGHISRSLEKKVLDVLIASLMDTVNEHPELATAAPGHSLSGSDLLQQLINPAKSSHKTVDAEAQQSTLPKGEVLPFSKTFNKSKAT